MHAFRAETLILETTISVRVISPQVPSLIALRVLHPDSIFLILTDLNSQL